MDEIKTDRLCIRPMGARDVEAVVAGLSQLDVSQWLSSIPHPFTHADLRITDADGASLWPQDAAIEHEGELIGAIGGGERLGYWLKPEMHGRGLGFEAAWSMVDYTFRRTEVEHIRTGVFVGNLASNRILEKIGFAETGLRDEFCAALGSARPMMGYELTRDAWEARE